MGLKMTIQSVVQSAIIKLKMHTTICWLHICYTQLTDEKLKALSDAKEHTNHPVSLDLLNNQISNDSVKKFRIFLIMIF